MKDYLLLQYLMTNRKLKEAGINPLIGYLLVFIAFVLFSEFIFQKTEFAEYLLIFACLSYVFNLSKKSRSEFLTITFGDQKNKIRLVENLFISIPFVIILFVKEAFYSLLILLVINTIAAFISFQINLKFTLPTPFSKSPFEFTTGFRKSIIIFPIYYILAIIAVYYNNFNLGIFSTLLIFLTALSFYSKPENEYYVWIHADAPKFFLIKKIKIATKCVLILNTPVLLLLCIFFPAKVEFVLLFILIGLFYLWTMILAKYSVYPREMNLPEGILIAFSIILPPVLFFLMPHFYNKSIQKLKLILDDKNY